MRCAFTQFPGVVNTMSSRKSKSGSGKSSKKSNQPAKKDVGTHTHNPTTSGRNKPKIEKGKFDRQLTQVESSETTEGRREREDFICDYPTSTWSRPQFHDTPATTTCTCLSDQHKTAPTSRSRTIEDKTDPASRSTKTIEDRWDENWPEFPISQAGQESERPNIESQVKEAIASGLAQSNDTFQNKIGLLQDAFETNSRKTQRAMGLMYNSMNRVKVNLEMVDSTLDTMNSRLVEFQRGIKTGLKELTVEVGHLASTLAWNGRNSRDNLAPSGLPLHGTASPQSVPDTFLHGR